MNMIMCGADEIVTRREAVFCSHGPRRRLYEYRSSNFTDESKDPRIFQSMATLGVESTY